MDPEACRTLVRLVAALPTHMRPFCSVVAAVIILGLLDNGDCPGSRFSDEQRRALAFGAIVLLDDANFPRFENPFPTIDHP